MNMQTHHSGQISGQVSSQSGTMLPGIPQQSGTSFASQMQNNNIHQNILSMDPEIAKMRRYMQEKIWEFLVRRGRQSHEVPVKKMMDIVKRLEEGLCRSAKSKEEYLDLGTLESRLQSMIKRPMNNHGQQFAHMNSSPSIGTMIPTPGFQHPENSSSVGPSSAGSSLVTINGSNAVASPTVNSGSSLPIRNGSSGIFKGGLAGGYQNSSPVFLGNSGGSNLVTSTGVQKMGSQMIPTPGIRNANNNKNNTGTNNTVMNIKPSNSFGACVTAESSGASQPLLLKQPLGGQNSRSHNIGRCTDGGNKSTVQQKSFGLSSGPSAGKLVMGKSTPVTNGPGAKGVHLEGTVYGNFTAALHQQHPPPVLQGDGYGIGVSVDDSGSRNSHAPVTSFVSTMNNQRMDPVSTESRLKGNSFLMANNQSQHHQQFQQPLHKFPNRQLAQHQVGNKQLQNKLSLSSDTPCPPQQSCNILSEAESGIGTGLRDGGPHSEVSHPFHFSDMQNAHRRDLTEGHSRDTKLLSNSADPQSVHISPTQASEQVQRVGANKSSLSDAALHSEKYLKSEDAGHVSGSIPPERNVQDEFHQRISGHDVAQLNNLSSDESVIGRCDSSQSAEPSKINDGILRSQKWLLFLKHARKCSASEGKCREPNCFAVQKLWKHIEQCDAHPCPVPQCRASKVLVRHHVKCQDGKCPVCVPVKNFVQERKSLGRSNLNSGSTSSANLSCNSLNTGEIMQKSTSMAVPVAAETEGDPQPPLKRLKTEKNCQSHGSESECHVALVSNAKDFHIQETQDTEQHHDRSQIKSEFTEVKMEVDGSVGQLSPNAHSIEMKKESLDAAYVPIPEDHPVAPNNTAGISVPEVPKTEKETEHPKLESTPVLSENAPKVEKTKIQAVSMVELFTIEQVQEHIASLRQWIGQSKAKAGRNQAMGNLISENSCQLCGVERLAFDPVPMYCTPCGVRIKRNAMYYTCGSGETRYFFCIPCYNNEARGDMIVVDGGSIPKSRFEKKKNDEETDEWWVQCDKCEAWQHQICALFNGRRNEGGQAEYTCPNCYVTEVQRGERVPLPQSAVLGAKDLPSTNLSDHLEQRLFAKLTEERQERARVQGKSYDEVPGAEALVVRVVSSVDKKLDVKPRFLEIFPDQNDYPTEFPYKSKVILLFQRIEGVEVCLFGMYVQEYGSECPQPNHRRVYLSYLDSVKYFRPDIKVVTGEALRTFVYHEILIGYLEHCKMRGFTSCYIWACPPLKGEDYILYCHPEIQKTPKSDKLREWYLAMLRKASKENIVVDLTNLYDHFFVSNGECKAKVTAARLPYFDGDYWPGAAEDFIWLLQQEDAERKQPKKGGAKKSSTKRALKASGQTDLSGNASKDLILMQKLGEAIFPMRDDFIMVHLQHACSHCCILMVSGTRWVCRQCKNFQLCDKCYDADKKLEDKERHPINLKNKHTLYPVEITGVPDDTKENEILESEFFDTRQAFLNLSQGNHYQYDTLRRAKHSSMMILYHLHNPTAPALVTQCATCHLDIEAGQVWRCETCLDYDVCNTCYQKNGGKDHPHKLTNQKSSDHNAQNQEARQLRVMQLRKMLDLLVHASQCRSTHCQYPNCRKVKALFRHGMRCQTRASGGCQLCKKMWYLLQIHARACKESQCLVPRCKDLKLHLKRLQQQSDSRRRAAVTEMMRQRSAEVRRNS